MSLFVYFQDEGVQKRRGKPRDVRRRDGGDVLLLRRGDPVPEDHEEPQSHPGSLQGAASQEGQLQVCPPEVNLERLCFWCCERRRVPRMKAGWPLKFKTKGKKGFADQLKTLDQSSSLFESCINTGKKWSDCLAFYRPCTWWKSEQRLERDEILALHLLPIPAPD